MDKSSVTPRPEVSREGPIAGIQTEKNCMDKAAEQELWPSIGKAANDSNYQK